MAAQIHILIGGHLATAPRAQKEARALGEAGHEVRVSGVWFDEEQAAQDLAIAKRAEITFSPALDFRPGAKGRLAVRATRRLALEMHRGGFVSPGLFGYGARELLASAEKTPADLTIVHSEAGLWVADQLLSRGRAVGIDFEDWFSRDLPLLAQKGRPLREMARIEKRLMAQARYRLATSHAMAQALAVAYQASPPTVVRNVFAERGKFLDGQRKDRRDPSSLSLHWFSQMIGPDRGLELLFQALPFLQGWVQVYLRGACSPSTRLWMDRLVPPGWRERVVVLPPVSQAELPSRIAEHDLGLALETDQIPSRDLTITNKIFHYLQAGLAIIATPTRGQIEVLKECGKAGTILATLTPEALAQAIDHHRAHPRKMEQAKQDSRYACVTKLCWEREKETLLAEAERALFAL